MTKLDDTSGSEQTRRKLLQSMAVLGIGATAAALPEKWSKPVLNAVVTPAHAATSLTTTTGAGTTPAPFTPTSTSTTTSTTTTPD